LELLGGDFWRAVWYSIYLLHGLRFLIGRVRAENGGSFLSILDDFGAPTFSLG
jgi:hypothetical protein